MLVRSKMDDPKGPKWTTLKVNRNAKVEDPSKTERSRAKLNGYLNQIGRSYEQKWTTMG